MARLNNYLRTHRRSWRLTQEELAVLFGYLDQSMVGRLERDERVIPLAVAHTCHLVFGVPPEEMFPSVFAGIEVDLYRRLYELQDRLMRNLPTQPVATKLELIHEAIRKLALLKQQRHDGSV
jgi:transcriptional regulator with XRE-family HTH domain